MFSVKQLRNTIAYDPKTGELRRDGELIKPPKNGGPHYISVQGVRQLAPRLVWFYVHGEYPPARSLGFKDGNKQNLKLDNLYIKGVFRACVEYEGKRYDLGVYSTKAQKEKAEQEALLSIV